MIVVLGKVQIQTVRLQEALDLSVQHVCRSRAEPGCIEHGVYQHPSDPAKLVFVEKWASMAKLQAHSGVPGTGTFITRFEPGATPRLATEIELCPCPT